jgi:hypothetical protein
MLLHVLKPEYSAARIESSIHYRDEHGQSADVNVTLQLDSTTTNPITDQRPLAGLSVNGEWKLYVTLKDENGNDLPRLDEVQDILLFVEYEHEQARLRFRETFDTDVTKPT